MSTSTNSRCAARAGRSGRAAVGACWNRRRLARAREGRDHGERGQILMVVQCPPPRRCASESSATTVGAGEFAIVVDDPVPRCARPAPAAAPTSASQIGADRPSSIVAPICEQQSAKKKMSTSTSSRSAAQPAGAGRSHSSRNRRAPRARVRAANRVNAARQ